MDVKELIDNPDLAVLIDRLENGAWLQEDHRILLEMLRKISREHELAERQEMIDEKRFKIMCLPCKCKVEIECSQFEWEENNIKVVGINYLTLRNKRWKIAHTCNCGSDYGLVVDIEANSGDIVRFSGTNCSLLEET